MPKWCWTIVVILLHLPHTYAQETEDSAADGRDTKPKTLSGMSILGNEEAPRSLVIVPWKSSEIGEDLSLTDTLDDRALPVDKEVFLRELRFYAIRSNESEDESEE